MAELLEFPERKLKNIPEINQKKKEIRAILNTRRLKKDGTEGKEYLFSGREHRGKLNREACLISLETRDYDLVGINFIHQQVTDYCMPFVKAQERLDVSRDGGTPKNAISFFDRARGGHDETSV